MLKLVIGLAGTGKTAAIYEEIKHAVMQKNGGRILIVPEQFSHEAERELCRTCGDTLSLYAEVLSFTGLSRAVKTELGGMSLPSLDSGGKLLCMALAVNSCADRLALFKKTALRPEMQSALLSAADSMKSSRITPDDLLAAAEQCSGGLALKLRDLALISEAYTSAVGTSRADPADELTRLAERIPESSRLCAESVIYVDGFTDFTNAEFEVLKALIKKGVTLTVCLTLDSIDSNNEIFFSPRSSAFRLIAAAKDEGQDYTVVSKENGTETQALFLADNIFTYTEETRDASGAVELVSAASIPEECAFAAAKTLELIRDRGYRRRDIAIAIRGFDSYAPVLESTFEEYGIPLFTARRTPLSVRPLPLLISCAYDIINSGWNCDDVISYIGTGLTGLDTEDCDILSTYIFTWGFRAEAWHRQGAWGQHPEGFGKEYTDKTRKLLERINSIRFAIAAPLLSLERKSKKAKHASEQALALYEFLEELDVPGQLERRENISPEYAQIWDITVRAIEQAHAVLGDMPMDSDTFSSLFVRMLSTYDVGIIPASLDTVSAGDFDRMRRRNIKNLIILGASSDRLPANMAESGIFTEDELMELEGLDACIGSSPESGMWREYSLIYSCVSLPSGKLIISYAKTDTEGNRTSPSVIMERASKLFRLQITPADIPLARTASEYSALKLAASGRDNNAALARHWFNLYRPGKLEGLTRSAEFTRGTLSEESVLALYGNRSRVSATSLDRFYECKQKFFACNGLKIKPYKPAVFSPADFGAFAHYVLQHTGEDIKRSGGFAVSDDSQIEESVRKHIREYEKECLNGLDEKSDRFIYILRRSEKNILSVALDIAKELRLSDFEPVAFEFNFSELTGGKMNGVADRVDCWVHDGKPYIRIADYKTGSTKFSLSDIWHGINMQLILYLDALCLGGSRSAQMLDFPFTTLEAAGAMYVPSYDNIVSVSEDDEKEIEKEQIKRKKRTGVVLAEDGVPEAWERGSGEEFSPVTYKKDGSIGGGAFTEEQVKLLRRHVTCRVEQMQKDIAAGLISADPYELSGNTPCKNCVVKGHCNFYDGENGEQYRHIDTVSSEDFWKYAAEENADE